MYTRSYISICIALTGMGVISVIDTNFRPGGRTRKLARPKLEDIDVRRTR